MSDKVGSESKRIGTYYFITKIITKRSTMSIISKKMKNIICPFITDD